MKTPGWFALFAAALLPAMAARPALAADASAVATAERKPVLVELFTSEGCSSCPPADRLLEKLDHQQPIAGAHIIVLSEHVDYWNHEGWEDPFSSPVFTERQNLYVRRLGVSGPYTPEMVVDGSVELVGNNERKADAAIQAAAQQPNVGVRILPQDANAALTIEVDALPANGPHKADVYLAQAMDSATSDVARGENKGQTLHHVSVVKNLRKLGTAHAGAPFSVRFPLKANSAAGTRYIAFIQEPDNGRVWGVAAYAPK